jgi:hypothetical protein
MLKIIYIILIFIIINPLSCELTATFDSSGYVYDIDTGEPLHRANVFISVDGYVESDYIYTKRDGSFFVYTGDIDYEWPIYSHPERIIVIAFKPGYNKVEKKHADFLEFYLKKEPE